MKLVQKPSPNSNARDVTAIDTIILHATADSDTAASVSWCCTPKPANPNPVSYHSIIDRDGTVFQLVDVSRRAWHAGVAAFGGHPDVNTHSIGLSFANRNDGEKYSDAQYLVGAALAAQYMRRFPKITLDRITTHAAVALPAGRKTDPVAFDMIRFKTLVAAELARLAEPVRWQGEDGG